MLTITFNDNKNIYLKFTCGCRMWFWPLTPLRNAPATNFYWVLQETRCLHLLGAIFGTPICMSVPSARYEAR
jgi:hypothetical protein